LKSNNYVIAFHSALKKNHRFRNNKRSRMVNV